MNTMMRIVKTYSKGLIKGALGSALMISLMTGTAYASDHPRSLSLDSRIKTIPYEKNNVTNITLATFVTTQFLFAKDQHIIGIDGGDADALSLGKSVLPYVMTIKPMIAGSQSDLMVTTMDSAGNPYFYRFHVKTVDGAHANPDAVTYAVQFVYPNQARARLLAKLNFQRLEHKAIMNASRNPKDYNWHYSFNGTRSIMPLHVFDDGKFTYLQLRKNQPVPAIFAVNNAAGKESVVNYRRVGNYLVIQQVAPQFTLRDGKYAVASIFNDRLINKLNQS